MMRVMTPSGALREVSQVMPICEVRLEFNGKNKRIVETANDMDCEPTALGFVLMGKDDNFSYPYDNELFIGNLKPEAVKEILQKLLSNGYYDFSGMEYQKAEFLKGTTFDKGATIPYTSEFTFGVALLEHIGLHKTGYPVFPFSEEEIGEDCGECEEVDGEQK